MRGHELVVVFSNSVRRGASSNAKYCYELKFSTTSKNAFFKKQFGAPLFGFWQWLLVVKTRRRGVYARMNWFWWPMRTAIMHNAVLQLIFRKAARSGIGFGSQIWPCRRATVQFSLLPEKCQRTEQRSYDIFLYAILYKCIKIMQWTVNRRLYA